ncbi:MAG: type III pantothenate kinase [Lentimicrobiaceae bacterium]|jgi:type III pantothenate kinase|nr:type III pantothenate kinase [Lentimicrobiaceae bacterium]
MNLVIDIGNTLTKIAFYRGNTLEELFVQKSLSVFLLKKLQKQYPQTRAAIISSVKAYPVAVKQFLKNHYIFVDNPKDISLPLQISYKTPDTLGNDRLAASVAAKALYPSENVLIIIAGSCITYDMVSREEIYLGGAISPGLQMRYKALHTFTGKLPLVVHKPFAKIIGETTEESIMSGVINGMTAEIDGMTNYYKNLFTPLKVILSGGDMEYFEKRLKNNIFAIPNIVLTGLNHLLTVYLEKNNH